MYPQITHELNATDVMAILPQSFPSQPLWHSTTDLLTTCNLKPKAAGSGITHSGGFVPLYSIPKYTEQRCVWRRDTCYTSIIYIKYLVAEGQ